MIAWLHSIDLRLFHFINTSCGNPLFDRLMPFVSNSPWFALILFALAIGLLIKGGARGRICVLMLALSLCIGNWLICDSIKHAVARPRPFLVLHDAILRIGMGDSYSMPSSHAANWFGSAMVLLVYFRWSGWIMVPLAMLVSFSRIYNGVHYPTDSAAGALLGASYSAATIWLMDALWQCLGPRWFPLWKNELPSLLNPTPVRGTAPGETEKASRDAQWLRLGYFLTAFLLFMRLAYLAAGKIELSEDEAYQWLWSKHLALSYYSKPPFIAYTQFLGTNMWGDTQFGVRFFSPVITALLSLLVLRFLARETSGKIAFFVLVMLTASPLPSLGSIVMTVDPLSVLFWTAAMATGWRAVSQAGTTKDWLWTGLWIGFGFLSKYTNIYQLICWVVFFALWPPARLHLRRSGPWLALLIIALCTIPVVIWNEQHGWITVQHVASDGQLGEKWHRTFTGEFLGVEAGVLNPVFFIGALWAAIAFWKTGRRNPWMLYLFSMGVPLFLMYFVLSFHSRVLANWIAPAIIPMFCLMAVYWQAKWKQHIRFLKPLMAAGVGVGAFAVVMAHDTQLLGKLIHRNLPPRLDLLHRAHGWKEMALMIDTVRQRESTNGHNAFIICEHYGFASEMSFYLPEAKALAPTNPLVFYRTTEKPDNQFYFWPDYLNRTGQNAVYVRELERPKFKPDWIKRWLHGDADLYLPQPPEKKPLPPEIQKQFVAVNELGIKDVVWNGNVLRRIQLFECLNLKPKGEIHDRQRGN